MERGAGASQSSQSSHKNAKVFFFSLTVIFAAESTNHARLTRTLPTPDMLATSAAAAEPLTLGAIRGLLFCKRPPPGGARPPPRIAPPPDPYGVFHGSWTVEAVHPCGRNTSLNAVDAIHALAPRPTAAAATDAVKAFLLQLALRRRVLKSSEDSESLRVAAKRARVAAQAVQLRALIRSGAGRKDGVAAEAAMDATTGTRASVGGSVNDDPPASAPTPAAVVAPLPPLSLAALHARPVWARSETNQAAVDDAHASELIHFARSLNADSYLSDLEDCAGVALARAQLAALENAASGARTALVAAEAAAAAAVNGTTAWRGSARGPSPDAFRDAVAPIDAAAARRGGVPASIAEGDDEDDEDADCGEAPTAASTGVSLFAKSISAAQGGANDGRGAFAVGGFWSQKG